MQDRQTYMQKYREEYKERKRRVTVTMDTDEYDLLCLEADQIGKSIPETLKEMALRYKSVVPLVPQANQELAHELRLLLRNMANNINQIAHNMNLNRHLYGPEANMHAHSVLKNLEDKLMLLEEEVSSVFLLYGK